MDNLLIIILFLLVVNCLLIMALFMRKQAEVQLDDKLSALKKELQDIQQQFKQDLLTTLQAMNGSNTDAVSRLGESNLQAFASLRDNITSTMHILRETQASELQAINKGTKDQMITLATRLDTLTKTNEEKLERLRTVLSESLVTLQNQNDAKLDEIRVTVGEKLQSTLEQRFALSFNVVNQQLDNVAKGIGEMRNLATEVGGLKKVLGNVKLRGNLGEVQLAAIIEQLLTPEQYATNIATVPNSSKRVEFAVKLPGREEEYIYLPVDSKFPADTYNKLLEAKETADKELIKEAEKNLRDRILSEAKDISEKYIKSPYTTDFAIMFLPFEGLYSEVLALDIYNDLQNKYHVMVAGPNTMAAMLNSLRMGFKTLALQKRTSEISQVLEAVKTEFNKFGACLDKMRGHLDSTSKDLDELMGARTKKINSKLRSFDTIELTTAENILQISQDNSSEDL